MFVTALPWGVLLLISATLAVGRHPSPVERPLPAALTAGAALGLVAAVVGLPWPVQVAAAAAAAVVLAGVLWRWGVLIAEDNLAPGVGGNRLVGRNGTVLTPVAPDGGSGTVRLGAERWRATTTTDTALAEGDAITVVAVEGIHVVVAPAERSTADHDHGGTPCP